MQIVVLKAKLLLEMGSLWPIAGFGMVTLFSLLSACLGRVDSYELCVKNQQCNFFLSGWQMFMPLAENVHL